MIQNLRITYWLSVAIIFTQCFFSVSAATLVWPDQPDGRLYRIDVAKKTLEIETAPNVWRLLGPIQTMNVAVDDFPPVTRVTCLNATKDQLRYLLVDCTQQVYRFDWKTHTLERLDKTFFRGYNCLSAKFVRRDTLYSLGGYGFWHTNNIMSYYKADSHEWESVNPGTNSPRSIYQGFNGCLPQHDIFLSALSLHQSDSELKGAFSWSDSIFAYHFQEKTWKLLGQLTTTVRQQLPTDLPQQATWFQLGQFFVMKKYQAPHVLLLLVDPIRNEVRLWKDVHKLLANIPDTDLYHSYVWQDTLYFRRDVTGATGKDVQTIRFTGNDLWKEATPLGTFYEPIRASSFHWLFILLAILGLGTCIFFWFNRSVNLVPLATSLPSLQTYPSSLNNQEKAVFNALLNNKSSDGLTADRLNEILGIHDKTLENQRKIRAEVIKGLNLKLKLEWGIDEAVIRVPTALDRRMHTYELTSGVHQRVQPT